MSKTALVILAGALIMVALLALPRVKRTRHDPRPHSATNSAPRLDASPPQFPE